MDESDTESLQSEITQFRFKVSNKESLLQQLKLIFAIEPFPKLTVTNLDQAQLESLMYKITEIYGSHGVSTIDFLKKILLFLQTNCDIIPYTLANKINSLSIMGQTSLPKKEDFRLFLDKLFSLKPPSWKAELISMLKFHLFSMASAPAICELKKEHILLDQMVWLHELNNTYLVHPLTEELKAIILDQASFNNPEEVFLFPQTPHQSFERITISILYTKIHPQISMKKVKKYYDDIHKGRTFYPPKRTDPSNLRFSISELNELKQRKLYLKQWRDLILN